MKQDKIEHFGKERDERVFKAIKNATLIITVVLALLYTAAMASASTTIPYDATRTSGQSSYYFNSTQLTSGFTTLTLTNQLNYTAGMNFTMEVWIQFNNSGVSTTNYGIIGENAVMGLYRTNNNILCSLRNTTNFGVGSQTAITIGALNQFVCAFNGTHTLLYQNATLMDSDAIDLRNQKNSTNGITIMGTSVASGNLNYTLRNDTVPSIRIWNQTLTSAEITSQYNRGANKPTNITTQLLADWILNSTNNYMQNSTTIKDISFIRATTLYINNTNIQCSDNYLRSEATDISTPWCLPSSTNIDKIQGGDTLYLASSTYNTRIPISNINWNSSVKIIGQERDNVILQNIDTDFNKTNNGQWSNASSSSAVNIWKTSSANVVEFASIFWPNGTAFFIYANLTSFNSSNNQYDYSMWSDDANNLVYVKSNITNFNPNNYSLMLMGSDYEIMSLDKINGTIEIYNVTFKYAKWGIFIRNVSQVTLDNISMQYATRGIRAKDAYNTNITLKNSWFNSYFDSRWYWMDLHKPEETYSETKGVANANMFGSFRAFNNTFSNWSNGFTLTHGSTRYSSINNLISEINFVNIYDDAIEIENRVSNWTIRKNYGNDVYVSISIAPAECVGTCLVEYNYIKSNKTIKWNTTAADSPGYSFKADTQSSQYMDGWTIDHNTFYAQGPGLNGINKAAIRNNNFTNNIFYSLNGSYVLTTTGYAINNTYYNNNLYYIQTITSSFFNQWNNATSNQASLSAALSSAFWDGTWDTNSIQADPQLNAFLQPNYNSLVCGSASDGSDIGAITCTSAPSILTLYVNISHASCSANYTRGAASNPSTPWCDISTAETNAQDGDTVIVADGIYRNTNGYTFNVKYNSTVTFNFQSNNTIITRAQSNAETISNTVWTNISNSTYTNRWTYSYSTSSSTVSAEYASTNQPILRCSYQNITLTYASRGFECTYFNTTTSTLTLDLAPGVNPQSTSLYVFNGDVITFDNAHNVKFVGGTIRGGWQLIDSSASGQSKNLTFENINFRGGTSDTGAIDVRRIDGFQVLNSTFYRTQLSSWWWYMIKQSNLGGETAAIFCADGCNNTIIANTTIYGYFNGMSLINTTNGSNNGQTNFHNIKIEYNNITDVYDDAIELEGIGNNITIFNNTVYDAFVAISLTPFNNTMNAMIVNYNRLHSVKRINYTKSGSTFTTIQGESFKLLLNNSLVNAVLDHNSMYGDRNIACRASSTQVYTNCMYNVNITNNVMLSENNYVLDASGLNSSKVYYNNNLYFNATGGSFIFRYWNSLTDNNYQTLALAKASANNPGTWDTNSFDQSPLIANFLTGNFTPASNSPLCGAASDGTDIGSEACAAYVYQIIGVNITNPSSLIINGTLNFQVNYTITGTEPLYCDLYVNGIYNNNQSTPSAGDYSVVGSVPTNGTYNYYITCTDQIFATNTTTNYSITMNKVLINATQTQFIPNSNSCIGSNCAGGNNSLAFDGNISTKANYIVGTTSYISNLFSNYSAPSGTIASKLYYFLYCNSDYSGTYDLNNNQYNSGVIALQGYLADTGFKANYLGVWNGTDYQLIGGTYICGSGGSSTHGYYETYLNNTLFYALNFTNINNSYSLKQRMFNITTNLINNNGLGGAINYTFRVYNSSGSLVDSGMINAVSPNATFQTNLTMNGLYYYNVTAENSTHFAISQLYSVNVYDFAVTINNPTSYQNFNNTLLINWTASFSGNSSTTILGANITIDSILIANMQAMNSTYQWNNTYNYNLSLGYHTLGVNIVDSSGANTNTTVIVNHTYNTLLNITARTALGNGTINQFTGWIYSNQTGENRTFNITNGMGLFNFTRGIVTVYLESINYSIDLNISLVDINITSSQYNLQFYLYETNSLNVTFYDQANPSVLLTGVNITLDLISDSYSNSYSTTNGSMYLPLLQAETYIVRYSAPNYALRFYTVTIDDRTAQSIQLYLVSTNVSQNVTITIQDEVLNPVEGAIVKALKYDLATNTYILQEIGTTDVNGKVIMSLTLNDEYYKFIVEYPSGTVVQITDPAYILSNSFKIVLNFASDIISQLLEYETISYSLTFNTLSNNFRLDYTDANNIASQYCLYVYQMNNASQTLYGLSCQTGSSGTILVPVENSSGLVYQAKAVYTDNGDSQTKFLASLYQEFPWISALATRYGLFLQLLITLAFTALFILNAGVAIIGVAFSLILGKLIGLNAFSWLALIALQVASLIMGIALAMRRT